MNIKISNLGLKIVSLIMAVLVWLYIVNEIQIGRIKSAKVLPSILGYDLVEKKVEIKPNLIGDPVEGYYADIKNIEIDPKHLIIICPAKYVKDIEYVYTEEVDLSEFTKDIRLAVKLSKFVKGYTPRKNFINMRIPIRKIERK